jgi:hypothetical protein
MRYRLALVLVLLTVQSSSAPPRVAIVRATAFAFDDEAISILIQVEPNAHNRALVIAAVEEGVAVRQSYEQLDGEQAMRSRWIKWGTLPAGDLMLVASLLESGSKPVAVASRPIHVIARR